MPLTRQRLAALTVGLTASATIVTGLSASGAAVASIRPAGNTHRHAGSSADPRAATRVSWAVTPTGSTDQFRGLAAVNKRVAWVSGETGTVLRTTDRGRTWEDVSPPAAAGLALRDIEAWSRRKAAILSIGTGGDSRIYTTSNGGASWTERFRNHNPKAFYDCMAFSAHGRGLAMSDPVNGHFRLAVSNNFGRSWHVQSTKGMPKAEKGEFGFAASGTCISWIRRNSFAFVTGGVDVPRVFRTHDGGRSWTATDTPLRGGPSAGIYSVAFKSATRAVIVGGDYVHPHNGVRASAYLNGSRHYWELSTRSVHGYRSGVAFVRGRRSTVIAVGPTGSDVSRDGGRTWRTFGHTWYDGVECTTGGACWASGTNGRVARLVRD
jgi:photosystem II stability/assembly factor-like uncharacterized protein